MTTMKQVRANRIIRDCMKVMCSEWDNLQLLVIQFEDGKIQANKARRIYANSIKRVSWYSIIMETIRVEYSEAYAKAYSEFDMDLTQFEVYIKYFDL